MILVQEFLYLAAFLGDGTYGSFRELTPPISIQIEAVCAGSGAPPKTPQSPNEPDPAQVSRRFRIPNPPEYSQEKPQYSGKRENDWSKYSSFLCVKRRATYSANHRGHPTPNTRSQGKRVAGRTQPRPG